VITLYVLSSAVLGALLGFFLFSRYSKQAEPEKERDWVRPFSELDLRMEVLETRWKRVIEELEERIERGNDAWRRYRSREAGRERRAQLKEESEGEPVDDAQEILQFDVSGSDPRGLSYMPEPLENAPEPSWKRASREIARSIVGGSN